MRKNLLVVLFVFLFVILSGCGSTFSTENIDKMVSVTSTNEELSNYITSIQAVETERAEPNDEPYYWYDITGELTDSFDELSNEEKYDTFAKIVKIMQENAGEMNDDSEFYCGIDIECNIGRIDLKTSNHTYGVEYYPDHSSDLFWMDDDIVYDDSAEDGKYIDPLADNKNVDEKEHENPESNLDVTTATGEEWVSLSYNEKYSLVSEALSSMSETGSIKISADADWFIDALNAYWKDSTTSEKVIEIIAISGVAGEVIEQ